jgi:preprotein translocase subunit SecA
MLNIKNLFDEENTEVLSRFNCALHAEHLLHKDIDYIIRKGNVELVDEFTGRIADKRRWPDGLQAAIEVKENINVQSKGKILNSITLQHFLQLYPKICGMTATALEAEKEFKEFYNLDIVIIPPNKKCIRINYPDIIFKTRSFKQKALVKEITEVHNTERPILVGTRSIEESIELSEALTNENIQCNVLNAKNDELEAAIVAEAGKPGAVTISTNMAGRGTDIKLGGENENEKRKIAALGGLYVIGTNRNESRRIDNQLRGRAGRQGDPGSSRFFISIEDNLFVKYNLKKLLPTDYIFNKESEKIDDTVVVKEIERIQRIIEGQNLEIKKTLYKYSSLLEQQRKIIFEKRNNILNEDSFIELFKTNSPVQFNRLLNKAGELKLIEICRRLSLLQIDEEWSQYLAEIADLREGIHLLKLGGQEPIFRFREQSIQLFDKMLDELDNNIIQSFNKLKVKDYNIDLNDSGLKAPSSTWTYLINDTPFENTLGIELIGNIGMSIGAGIYGFLFVIQVLMKKLIRKKSHRN